MNRKTSQLPMFVCFAEQREFEAETNPTNPFLFGIQSAVSGIAHTLLVVALSSQTIGGREH